MSDTPILTRQPLLRLCSWGCAAGLALAGPVLAQAPLPDAERQQRREELRRHLRMERERWHEESMARPGWATPRGRALHGDPDGPAAQGHIEPGSGPWPGAIRGRRGHADRAEQAQRPDHAERSDRLDRPERPDRPERLSPEERRALRQSLRDTSP